MSITLEVDWDRNPCEDTAFIPLPACAPDAVGRVAKVVKEGKEGRVKTGGERGKLKTRGERGESEGKR
jgi:hypothetical protein